MRIGPTGFEPAISCPPDRRDNQASLRPDAVDQEIPRCLMSTFNRVAWVARIAFASSVHHQTQLACDADRHSSKNEIFALMPNCTILLFSTFASMFLM